MGSRGLRRLLFLGDLLFGSLLLSRLLLGFFSSLLLGLFRLTLQFRFRLRDGITFHDGRPLTSADVASTCNYMRDPEKKSPSLGSFAAVAAVETPDDQTIVHSTIELARLESVLASNRRR